MPSGASSVHVSSHSVLSNAICETHQSPAKFGGGSPSRVWSRPAAPLLRLDVELPCRVMEVLEVGGDKNQMVAAIDAGGDPLNSLLDEAGRGPTRPRGLHAGACRAWRIWWLPMPMTNRLTAPAASSTGAIDRGKIVPLTVLSICTHPVQSLGCKALATRCSFR